jgi:hypothetical protein
MKLKIVVLTGVLLVFGGVTSWAVTGPHGEVLTASKVSNIKSGETILVSGKNFDTTVGIYVEMCQVVPIGTLPSVCGGGVNMSGTGAASFWISSNPPSYGKNLAIPFKVGGVFKVGLKVQPLIGKIDCRKSACAIYVRADHTRTQDRTHDIKLPITFSK